MNLKKYLKTWEGTQTENKWGRIFQGGLIAIVFLLVVQVFSKETIVTIQPFTLTEEAWVTKRAQLSLLEGSEYDYFFFVTNTTLLSEKVVIYYEKRGNAENYIKEAKYDMAVGHLLLKSFWANEAVFQMMMLSYNLFLLFKFDSLDSSEYRQQIKTFRLKYVFLAAKIIKTARYVIMKLSENYPYKGVYEKCLV